MYDLAVQTNSIIHETYDADSAWSVGGLIKSDEWTADDLTILRAYEWDRINFSDPKKLARTAKQIQITVEELNKIRERTRKNALDAISNRQEKNDKNSITRAADVAQVSG